MKFIDTKRVIFLSLVTIVLFLLITTDVKKVLTLEQLKLQAIQLQQLTQEQYWTILVLYFLFFIIATILFVPVTIILTILAGFLFGGIKGGIFATIAATIGGSVTFLVVRHLLGSWLYERYEGRLEQFNQEFKRHGARYLLMLQLSPVTPTIAINLFIGLTQISLWTYVWTTFVGIFPGSIIYAVAGQKLQHITSIEQIMPPILFFILLFISLLGLIPLIYKQLFMKEKE